MSDSELSDDDFENTEEYLKDKKKIYQVQFIKDDLYQFKWVGLFNNVPSVPVHNFDKEDYSIYFDVEYSERKVVLFGDNFFAFEHGDVSKKNTALVYATEFPLCWGHTTYRTCYTGHFHSKKTIEYTTEIGRAHV